MNRPPKPTKYKHGDVHEETGRIFRSYFFSRNKWYDSLYHATNKIDAQIEIMYTAALQRARNENLPFDIDIEYLKSIRTNLCPIFGIVLAWGVWDKYARNNSPSLDRIIPEYGYIKGNVCIISNVANKMKQDMGYEELYKIADWLHDKTKEVKENVRPEQLTSIPTKSRREGKDNSQLSLVLAAGTGEDSDDFDDYRGATEGENSYRSAKEGSGVSLGYRGEEVEAFDLFDHIESSGALEAAPRSLRESFERLRSQSREPSLAAGTASQIRQFGD